MKFGWIFLMLAWTADAETPHSTKPMWFDDEAVCLQVKDGAERGYRVGHAHPVTGEPLVAFQAWCLKAKVPDDIPA